MTHSLHRWEHRLFQTSYATELSTDVIKDRHATELSRTKAEAGERSRRSSNRRRQSGGSRPRVAETWAIDTNHAELSGRRASDLDHEIVLERAVAEPKTGRVANEAGAAGPNMVD
jgi:hypothetical protein